MCLKPDAETGYTFCYIEQSNPKKILRQGNKAKNRHFKYAIENDYIIL
jgi:hypothetical protein